MLINSILCADCTEAMSTYELHDFYCAKSKLVLQIEECVCLKCSANAMQVINVYAENHDLEIGRSESLEISLTSERIERKLSDATITKLIVLHFLEKIKNICVNKKKHIWYDRFEVDLWESLHGISTSIELSEEEINLLKVVSNNLNVWVISPSNWVGFEKQPNPFIQLRAWKKLYENRATLFKQTANEQQHNPGKSAQDSKSEV